MNNRTAEQLETRASEIIVQDGHDKPDTKELSKIRYFLSTHYKKINTLGGVHEGLYNTMRAKNTVDKQNAGMAVGKAENEAKAEAEAMYPNRREENAEAAGIGKLLETIGGFIINLQIEQKVLDQVYTGQ